MEPRMYNCGYVHCKSCVELKCNANFGIHQYFDFQMRDYEMRLMNLKKKIGPIYVILQTLDGQIAEQRPADAGGIDNSNQILKLQNTIREYQLMIAGTNSKSYKTILENKIKTLNYAIERIKCKTIDQNNMNPIVIGNTVGSSLMTTNVGKVPTPNIERHNIIITTLTSNTEITTSTPNIGKQNMIIPTLVPNIGKQDMNTTISSNIVKSDTASITLHTKFDEPNMVETNGDVINSASYNTDLKQIHTISNYSINKLQKIIEGYESMIKGTNNKNFQKILKEKIALLNDLIANYFQTSNFFDQQMKGLNSKELVPCNKYLDNVNETNIGKMNNNVDSTSQYIGNEHIIDIDKVKIEIINNNMDLISPCSGNEITVDEIKDFILPCSEIDDINNVNEFKTVESNPVYGINEHDTNVVETYNDVDLMFPNIEKQPTIDVDKIKIKKTNNVNLTSPCINKHSKINQKKLNYVANKNCINKPRSLREIRLHTLKKRMGKIDQEINKIEFFKTKQ